MAGYAWVFMLPWYLCLLLAWHYGPWLDLSVHLDTSLVAALWTCEMEGYFAPCKLLEGKNWHKCQTKDNCLSAETSEGHLEFISGFPCFCLDRACSWAPSQKLALKFKKTCEHWRIQAWRSIFRPLLAWIQVLFLEIQGSRAYSS